MHVTPPVWKRQMWHGALDVFSHRTQIEGAGTTVGLSLWHFKEDSPSGSYFFNEEITAFATMNSKWPFLQIIAEDNYPLSHCRFHFISFSHCWFNCGPKKRPPTIYCIYFPHSSGNFALTLSRFFAQIERLRRDSKPNNGAAHTAYV